MSTPLLLSALLPVIYLIAAAGSVRRFYTKPGKLQVYSVLRFRWHLLGASALLWLAGTMAGKFDTSAVPWLTDVTGLMLIVLLPVSLFISGCKMFSAVWEAKFLSQAAVKTRLSPDDPVIGLEINGESHAYPIKWIQHSQIVEDVVGGQPVIVTYSVHSEKAVAFSAEFRPHSLRLIYPPHMEKRVLLYDSSTKRLIKQLSGEIIFGPNRGSRIPTLQLRIVPWVTWESLHPESKVFFHVPRKPAATLINSLVSLLRQCGLIRGSIFDATTLAAGGR